MNYAALSDAELDHRIAMARLNPMAADPREVEAMQAERAARKAPKPAQPAAPDNVESDLDAAATPITPDPVVKPKPAAPAKPRWRTMTDDEMLEPVVDAPGGGVGVTAGDLGAYGDRYRQAVHNRIERGAERRAAEREAGRPDADQYAYDRATGLSPEEAGMRPGAPARGSANAWAGEQTMMTPGGLEVPVAYDDGIGGQYYTLGAEREAQRQQDEAYRRAGGRRAVPSPRDDATGQATQGREFSSPEEAEQYYTRPRDPRTGALQPSQADRDMMARGYFPVYTPDGEITYRMGANRPENVAQGMSPSAQRQAGYYEGVSADGRTDLELNRNYEMQRVEGPFGPVNVLVPTRAARETEANRRQRDSARRVAAKTGESVDAMMDPEKRRDAYLTKYERDDQERRKRRSDMARLAGGSQNLNSGNNSFFQALAMLEGVRPDAMDAQQRAMMQMMPMDPNRAAVEARQLDMAGRMAQNAVTAFLTNNPGANGGQAMRDIAQAQAESQLPPEVQAERHQRDPNVHPSEIAAADAYVSQLYSSPGWYFGGGNSSEFTIQEQNDTINHLVNDLGYDPVKAQKIVDEIARRRHQSSAFGNPTRDAQPSPAAPPAPPGPARNPAGPGRQID